MEEAIIIPKLDQGPTFFQLEKVEARPEMQGFDNQQQQQMQNNPQTVKKLKNEKEQGEQ